MVEDHDAETGCHPTAVLGLSIFGFHIHTMSEIIVDFRRKADTADSSLSHPSCTALWIVNEERIAFGSRTSDYQRYRSRI